MMQGHMMQNSGVDHGNMGHGNMGECVIVAAIVEQIQVS